MVIGDYFVASPSAPRLTRINAFLQRFRDELASLLLLLALGLLLLMILCGLIAYEMDNTWIKTVLTIVGSCTGLTGLIFIPVAAIMYVTPLFAPFRKRLCQQATAELQNGDAPNVTYININFCTLMCAVMINKGGLLGDFNRFMYWAEYNRYNELATLSRRAAECPSNHMYDLPMDLTETLADIYSDYLHRKT